MLKTDELSNNLTTISKSLTITQAWMDTGIKYTDLPANGTYIDWSRQGCYTHLKTNNKKIIFNLARLTGVNYGSTDGRLKYYCQPFICSYNYSNPILTTINNLSEEIEKTEDYTMKITYRVSWDSQ